MSLSLLVTQSFLATELAILTFLLCFPRHVNIPIPSQLNLIVYSLLTLISFSFIDSLYRHQYKEYFYLNGLTIFLYFVVGKMLKTTVTLAKEQMEIKVLKRQIENHKKFVLEVIGENKMLKEENDGLRSGKENDGLRSGRENDGLRSGKENDGLRSGKENDGLRSGKENDGLRSGKENDGLRSGRGREASGVRNRGPEDVAEVHDGIRHDVWSVGDVSEETETDMHGLEANSGEEKRILRGENNEITLKKITRNVGKVEKGKKGSDFYRIMPSTVLAEESEEGNKGGKDEESVVVSKGNEKGKKESVAVKKGEESVVVSKGKKESTAVKKGNEKKDKKSAAVKKDALVKDEEKALSKDEERKDESDDNWGGEW